MSKTKWGRRRRRLSKYEYVKRRVGNKEKTNEKRRGNKAIKEKRRKKGDGIGRLGG